MSNTDNLAAHYPTNGYVMFLPSDDLGKVQAFYQELLGLPLVRNQQDICHIYRMHAGSYVGFCQRGYCIPADYRVVLTLLIDDVDGVYAWLQQQGVVPESAPALHESYNVYSFFVRDPNGYLLEIQRFVEALP